jgi:Trk K+ transport system NAD-binding subunit
MASADHGDDPGREPPLGPRAVLVCGLGSLGVECILVLQRYGVAVRAIDLRDSLGDSGSAGIAFVRGDCRKPEVLRLAGIEGCGAVVLVTGDPHANVEAAMAARKIDASIKIVARAAQDNVNELLSTLLGRFVAYEPGRLAAGALALAASTGETIGHFRVEGRVVHVTRRRIESGSRWRGSEVRQLGRHGVFVVEHTRVAGAWATGPASPDPSPDPSPSGPGDGVFHRYDPEGTIEEGDVLTTLSVEHDPEASASASPHRALDRRALVDWVASVRRSLRQPSRVVVASLAAIAVALTVAAIAFPRGDRSLSTIDGLFTALVLMTGGTYADLFPPFNHISNALRLLSVTLSVIGTMFVGLLYAWFTERLMTVRLRLGPRRPQAPHGDHVVVVGLGRVGRHAAAVLQQLAHPLAAIDLHDIEGHSLPEISVVKGNGADADALAVANIAGARAVLVTTRDEWMNLEIGLQVRRLNPGCELVIRTHGTRFSRNIAGIVPRLRALCVPEIAARAFAAAALGGQILDLFQLGERTVYVVEHVVGTGDGLDGRLLSEIAEGYSVVPVWCATRGHEPRFWSPADPVVRLTDGDRVVFLGPSLSLQWIERGQMRPREVFLRLVARRPFADPLAVASVLVQHTGCTLDAALGLLQALPRELPDPLYPLQAQRLKGALEDSGTWSELLPTGPAQLASQHANHANCEPRP